MSKGRIIPENMISANDAARMIVRSSLIVAPSDMREKYTAFVNPVSMGKNYGDEGDISPKVLAIFDGLVEKLKNVQFAEGKKATVQEIKEQVSQVLNIARDTIRQLEEHQKETKDESTGILLPQLKTITENISTRTVVESYPAKKSMSSGLYGSVGSEKRRKAKPEIKEEKEGIDSTPEERIHLISGKEKNYGTLKKK